MNKPHGMSERNLQKSIRTWLLIQGFEVIKLTTMRQYGSVGWPDLLVLSIAPRLPLFLEVKTKTGVVTPLQAQRHETLRERGYPTFVVQSLTDVKLIVEAWAEFEVEEAEA